jgi:DNA primase
MDVIALAQHGVPFAVATLGTATSTYHIQLLAKHCKQLIFCFDGDQAGQQAAWRGLESSLPHLNSGLDIRFIFLPEQHDPDSLIREEGKDAFLNRIQQAKPFNFFFFETLSQGINLHNPSGRTQLINLAKPHLQKITEGSYKQLLLNDLSRLTHIDTHRLNQLLISSVATKLPEPNNSISRSPLRIAMALLLQNPEIYVAQGQHINLALLHKQDHHILISLMEQLKENPGSNTATLLEPWRDTPYFEALNKLAAWDHQVPEQELTREFMDTLHFLQKQHHEVTIQQWIAKARQEGLTELERINLQDMLKKRHLQTDIEK